MRSYLNSDNVTRCEICKRVAIKLLKVGNKHVCLRCKRKINRKEKQNNEM